jgi:hypothetical protein
MKRKGKLYGLLGKEKKLLETDKIMRQGTRERHTRCGHKKHQRARHDEATRNTK